jgi:hypothetical protein
MQYNYGNIYTLDVKRRDIVTFDENFENMHITGTPGPGPKELTYPVKFYVLQDTVFVLDGGSKSIKSFYDNNFLDSYPLTGAQIKRFFCTSNYFFIPYVTDSSTFFSANKHTFENRIDKYSGKVVEFESKQQTFLRNHRHLLYDDENFFYTISDNISEVEKYDIRTLNLAAKFDFSDISIIKKNLNFIASQKKDVNSYYVYIEDSYPANNSLYLLIATLGTDYSVNHLIKITLYPQMEVTAVYRLPGTVYTSFCVSPDYIFAFDRFRGTIDRIKLPDL